MDQVHIMQAARDPQRLAVLQQLNLLDTSVEEAFDRLTRLASKITGSPISLVTLIDADRQFFKSAFGLPEPVASIRETPLSYSFCKHVVASGEALVVEDARKEPAFKDNLAVSEFGIVGYLGSPLTTTSGIELGSFCVLDVKPRQWNERDIEIIRELALSVMTEIELRAQIKAREEAQADLLKQNRKYRRVYHFASITLKHMRKTIRLGTSPKEMVIYLDQMEKELSRL